MSLINTFNTFLIIFGVSVFIYAVTSVVRIHRQHKKKMKEMDEQYERDLQWYLANNLPKKVPKKENAHALRLVDQTRDRDRS